MPKLTPEEQEAFLHERGILCRIATLNADGSPYVTPAWFIEHEGRICITPRARSVWLENVRRDPRVSITIDEDPHPYRKVRLDGVARIDFETGRDDEWRDLYREIAKRYTTPEGAESYIQNTIDQPRALISVGLSEAKVSTWRMPLAGEPPASIWHDRYYLEGTALKGQQ
jgi:PPOX class probable F420-dependent enzyme